jgi:hypothetical protein
MANTRILYNLDTWDAATVTGSSQANTDLVPANVLHDHVSKLWRTTGKASENIVFDLGAATNITVFSMFTFNLTASATVTLQANTADSWGSPAYSQALTIATDADGNVLQRLVYFLDQTYRYWRVTFADSGNAASYLQIGRIAAGTYYEPPRNINQNFTITMYDPSEGDRVAGRQTFFRNRNRYRRAAVRFELQNQTQTDKLDAIMTKVGHSKPVVLALDPTNRPSKDSMYCYLEPPLSLAHQFIGQYSTAQLVFEEKTE